MKTFTYEEALEALRSAERHGDFLDESLGTIEEQARKLAGFSAGGAARESVIQAQAAKLRGGYHVMVRDSDGRVLDPSSPLPKNANGHELGCKCEPCETRRRRVLAKLRARIREGEETKSFAEILEEELAKRRDL